MKNSIKRDLSLRLSIMIFLIGTIVGVSYSIYSLHNTRAEFENEITQQTENISSMLTLQLWLFDVPTSQKLCSHLIKSSLITGIQVRDSEQNIIFNEGSFDNQSNSTKSRELLYHDDLVGFLKIGFSNHSLSEQMKSLQSIGIFILLVSAASSFLLVNYLLEKHLVDPLQRLKKSMDHLASGEFKGSSITNQKKEIQQIIESFNDLVEKLEERDTEILEKNKRLEYEVAERAKANTIFKALAEPTTSMNEQELFNSIVQKACELLNCNGAMLGVLTTQKTISSLALQLDGKPQKNISYPVPGSPCEKIIDDGYIEYTKDINKHFPANPKLLELNANSFIGTTLKKGDGKIIGVLCTFSNGEITLPKQTKDILDILQTRAVIELERVKMSDEKRNIEFKLRQAQKMEAIGTLAGGIAHDFNNILTAIMGYADMAKEDVPKGSEIENDLNNVIDGGLRAKELVKQILAFSRQSDTERIAFQPASVIKEAHRMLRSSIPTTITIEQDIDPEANTIFADPTQVHQILLNLCTNAFHAMEDTGGIITISLNNVIIGQKQANNLHISDGNYVQLEVKDTGKGISPDIQDRIFDPYFTTKEIGKGTGMGLAIIHGIIQEYGGAITVESEIGKGSTLRVLFPVTEKDPSSFDDSSAEIVGGTERILFIDDEEILAKMGATSLKRLGYKVTSFTDSQEALDIFKKDPTQFDLIITDQTMPNLTGAEIAKEVLRVKPSTPIILCTGYSTIISESEAKEMGIKEFVLKPISRKKIAKVIRNVLS